MAFAVTLDPLSWLLSHPQLILVVAGTAAWLFKKVSAVATRAGGRDPEEGTAVTGEAERTRRVQEEVRRKIAERQGRRVAPPLVAPRPIAQPVGWPLRREPDREVEQEAEPEDLPTMVAPVAAVTVAPLPSRSLATPAAVAREALAFEAATKAAPAPSVGSMIAAELSEPANVRRAILWREILGPPVGLR